MVRSLYSARPRSECGDRLHAAAILPAPGPGPPPAHTTTSFPSVTISPTAEQQPTTLKASALTTLLRRFAHRAQSAWRADIAVPTSMTYDGSSYRIEVLRLNGTGAPSPDAIKSQVPIVTGEPVLLSPDAKPLPLAPWLIAQKTDDLAKLHCLLFDGLQYTKGNPTDTPFKYSKIGEGKKLRTTPTHSGGTWQSLAPWTTR